MIDFEFRLKGNDYNSKWSTIYREKQNEKAIDYGDITDHGDITYSMSLSLSVSHVPSYIPYQSI